jgi:hypothetical protein
VWNLHGAVTCQASIEVFGKVTFDNAGTTKEPTRYGANRRICDVVTTTNVRHKQLQIIFCSQTSEAAAYIVECFLCPPA